MATNSIEQNAPYTYKKLTFLSSLVPGKEYSSCSTGIVIGFFVGYEYVESIATVEFRPLFTKTKGGPVFHLDFVESPETARDTLKLCLTNPSARNEGKMGRVVVKVPINSEFLSLFGPDNLIERLPSSKKKARRTSSRNSRVRKLRKTRRRT